MHRQADFWKWVNRGGVEQRLQSLFAQARRAWVAQFNGLRGGFSFFGMVGQCAQQIGAHPAWFGSLRWFFFDSRFYFSAVGDRIHIAQPECTGLLERDFERLSERFLLIAFFAIPFGPYFADGE